MPPTPWHGNTSSVSSTEERDFQCTAQLEITDAIAPMKSDWPTVTKPAAGVTATRPTTAPTQAPSALGLRPRTPSKKTHASIAAALAALVVRNARHAGPLAASA